MAGANYKNLTAQLYCSNFADRRAQLTCFVATYPVVDKQAYAVPVQPRTIGIRVFQKF